MRAYPAVWSRMIAEWNSPGPGDRAWLLYAANYLFRTAGVRWALDPLTLGWRLPGAAQVAARTDLARLSFVLLSHEHTDHLDSDLIHLLADLPIQWVVPEFLAGIVRKAGLPAERIRPARSLVPIELSGMRITPFDGQHWELDPRFPGGRRGVPSAGYLVEWPGRRWLFPGDTRSYDASRLPDFGALDGVFAHLWLGRNRAGEALPPLLSEFCRHFLAIPARRIVLTHLEEFSRPPGAYWDERHAQLVADWYREHAPGRKVAACRMGDSIEL